jgi:hypothetical protein
MARVVVVRVAVRVAVNAVAARVTRAKGVLGRAVGLSLTEDDHQLAPTNLV